VALEPQKEEGEQQEPKEEERQVSLESGPQEPVVEMLYAWVTGRRVVVKATRRKGRRGFVYIVKRGAVCSIFRESRRAEQQKHKYDIKIGRGDPPERYAGSPVAMYCRKQNLQDRRKQ
jgi:hypothetical protein